MQSKTSLHKIVLSIVIIIAVFFAGYLFWINMKEPIPSGIVPVFGRVSIVSTSEEVAYGRPARLKIPAIKVDAIVEDTGVLVNGEMGAPAGPDDVAWFKFGPHPGEIGSAVIDGHYGWKDNLPAVFDRLKELKAGDKLTVEDDKGLVATFVVREIREYDPKADATDVFVSKDGKSHLNLVTCDGPWNRNTESRPNRIVVFTDKVE